MHEDMPKLSIYKKNVKKVSGPNFTWALNAKNIIYMIECKKDNCKKRYIGETDSKLISEALALCSLFLLKPTTHHHHCGVTSKSATIISKLLEL